MAPIVFALALLGASQKGGTEAPARPARERVVVEDVFATPTGEYVVILRTKLRPHRYLPIAIGEAEALSLRLRLSRRAPPRPLTLNLVESVIGVGKMKVSEISIDDWRQGVFFGRIRLQKSGAVWDLDARPADALGLAVGKEVPIFVSRKVLREAAIDPADLEDEAQDERSSSYDESL